MVEFGLILPVFFVLTVSLIDVGRAFYQYNSLAHAAREAARFGAVQGGSQNPGFNWADNYSGNKPATYSVATGYPASNFIGTPTIVGKVAAMTPGIDLSALSVTIAAPGGPSPGNALSVRLLYTFEPATALLIGGRAFPLAASSQMLIE